MRGPGECHTERVTGRKARGLQTEEIGCKWSDVFISLLSGRRKQTASVRFLSLLYTKLMLGWMEHKLESRLLGEIAITSDTQMTPPLWQKVKN